MTEEKKEESRIILARTDEKAPSAPIEIFTPEDMKTVKKLIYLKRFTHSVHWHFALPDTISTSGITTFCGNVFWSQVQTQNAKKFYQVVEKERALICEGCAFEYKNAQHELKKQGYI